MTACAEALRLLHQPGSVAELRIPKAGPKGTISGYFNDMAKMAAAAARWDGRFQGVYTTLNPVLPDLLARSTNRAIEHALFTTSDKDIIRRHWLPIDFDPARPAGISSSNAEHEASLELARQCRAFLREQDWPDPIYADSGNGAHLNYRIDLPTESNLVERVLRFLAAKFNGGAVKIDDAMHNSARIWKLYGTRACKGESTTDRPHRMSAILECPSPFEVVTARQLESLVGPEAPPPKSEPALGRPYEVRSFNLDEWIAKWQHRLPPLGIKRPFDGGGWKREFDNCPWNPEHTGRCAFIGMGSRGVVAACQHNSCQHKNWHDLKAVVGDTVTGTHKSNGQARTAPAKPTVTGPSLAALGEHDLAKIFTQRSPGGCPVGVRAHRLAPAITAKAFNLRSVRGPSRGGPGGTAISSLLMACHRSGLCDPLANFAVKRLLTAKDAKITRRPLRKNNSLVSSSSFRSQTSVRARQQEPTPLLKIAANPKSAQEFSVFRCQGELIGLVKHLAHTKAAINRQGWRGTINQHMLLRLANREIA